MPPAKGGMNGWFERPSPLSGRISPAPRVKLPPSSTSNHISVMRLHRFNMGETGNSGTGCHRGHFGFCADSDRFFATDTQLQTLRSEHQIPSKHVGVQPISAISISLQRIADRAL